MMTKEDFTDLLEDYLTKHKNASCLAGRDGEGFVEKMYGAFTKDSPADPGGWLKTNMKDRFLYADEPPVWTKNGERDWPYFEGEPMVFLHQFAIGAKETRKMKGSFPAGETIYVFGGKKNTGRGTWRTVYMLVGQDNFSGNRVHIDQV